MAVRGENSLFFASGLDNSGLVQGRVEAVNIIQGLAGQISKINPFAALGIGATAAFTMVAKSAYTMMKDFESAMAEVKTIANVSEAEFKKLENQVFSLYKQLGTESPDELARGLYDIIGSGYEASEALVLLEIASKAATAGITTSAVAADGLTTILNSFQLEAKDAAVVADVMFAAVDRGKISFEELSSQIAQVAPLAASSGYSFEEIAGAIATLTKQGVPGAQAMTQIRSAIEATNEVLGDGVAKSMTLQNAFQLVYDKAGGSQNKLKELTGRVEAVNGMLAIAGPNARGAAEDLEAMSNAAGSVNRAFGTVTATTTNQWSILGERIKATTKGIGESVLQMSNMMAGALNDALDSGTAIKDNYDEQRLELSKLGVELQRAVTGSEEFEGIKKKILDQYPEFIGEIDAEKASTQQLLDVLDKVNKAYEYRYKLASRQEDLNKSTEEAARADEARAKARFEFEKYVQQLQIEAKDNGIELQVDLNASTGDILNSIKTQLKEIAPESLQAPQIFPLWREGGFAAGQIQEMTTLYNLEKSYQNLYKQGNKDVEEKTELYRRLAQEDLKNEQGRFAAIEKINAATKESQVSEFVDSGVAEVEEALQARMKIITQLMSISSAKSIEELKTYLASSNDEISKAAERRARMVNKDWTPPAKPEDLTYKDFLKQREDDYKAYYAVLNQLGKEAADNQFANLLKEGEDYGKFLQNQLDRTKSYAEQREIALAAERNKINLSRNFQDAEITIQSEGIVKDVEIDTESIEYLQRKVDELRDKFEKAGEAGREMLRPELSQWEERLNTAKNGVNQEQEIYSNLRRGLEDLNNSQLRDYIKHWKDRLSEAKKGSEAEKKAVDNIESAENAIADNTADTLREVSGALSQASRSFRDLDEDVADALENLSGLGNGIANMIQGFSAGGLLGFISIFGGAVTALSSVISMFSGKSQVNEYEESIKSLERSIKRLGSEIQIAMGGEAFEKRMDRMTEYTDKLAKMEAELTRRENQYAELQNNDFADIWTIGGKTMAERIEEQKDAISEFKEEFKNAKDELDEYVTGGTAESFTDAILEGFKEGKKGIDDFAQTFDEAMQNTLLNIFKNNYLSVEIQKFYDQIVDAAGGTGIDSLTEEDIKNLQNQFGSLIESAGNRFEILQEILSGAGLDGFGSDSLDQKKGLTGAIQGMSEDTANILAGTFNAIRIDIRQSLAINEQSLNHLNEIAVNTRYNRFLESIDRNIAAMNGRISTIESGIQQFQAQG